jgi:hypothetical protein
MPWAVKCQRGEVYAIEETYARAVAQADSAQEFLLGALDCGHPRARSWVKARLPITCTKITRHEAYELRMEEGVPVLDREP